MADIHCSEGMVVKAKATEGIDFGGVTSCMTITCILESSGASEINKLAAHDGVFERVKPHIFEALKGRLEGRKVARIIAAGGGSYWSPEMKSQSELWAAATSNKPVLSKTNYAGQLDILSPLLISKNVDAFIKELARQFDVNLNAISFKNWDEGRVQITAAGELVTTPPPPERGAKLDSSRSSKWL